MSVDLAGIAQRPKYTLCNPYTGTLEQPDTVNLFIKTGKKIDVVNENIINTFGHSPLNYFHNLHSALWRISEATQKIFANIKGDRSDLWNAFKNLGRGIVQLFPVVGGAVLYLYDHIKIFLYGYPEIETEVASENGSVLGIAFDGKVIATFTLQEFQASLNRNSNSTSTNLDKPLVLLNYMWLSCLSRSIERDSSTTRHEIALSLANRIKRA